MLHDQLLNDHKKQQEREFEPIDNSQQINNLNYTPQVSNVNALSIQDDINVRYSDNFGYSVHDFNISNPSEPLRLSQAFEQSQASINLLESLSNHCQQQQNNATLNSLKSTNKGLMHVQDTETKTIYLIDNGAEKSIVPRTHKEEMEPCNIKLFSPNNSQFKVYGTKDIIVTLSNRPYKAKVIVADINYPILGIDFLKENRMIIDLDQYTIMSKNDNIIHQSYKRKHINLIQSTNDYPQINQLLNEFKCLFEDTNLTTNTQRENNNIMHHIKLKVSTPINSKPHYLAQEYNIRIKEHFEDLMDRNIVRRSRSAYSSPITIVKKNNGEIRVCGDYRKLNYYTVNDCYPLPHIHSFTHHLHKSKIFSKLDLKQAFYQIPMYPPDIQKTAVITSDGLFEFLKMPFGLKTASQSFQRQMDCWFGRYSFTFSYIDDLIIHSEDLLQHLKHLRVVFEILSSNNMKINREKSQFARSTISYLSYQISESGIKPSDERLETFADIENPKTIGQLRKFLGILNYFSRFIHNYSALVKPLTAIKSIAFEMHKRRQIFTDNITTKAPIFANTKRKKQVISQELIVIDEKQMKSFQHLKDSLLKCVQLKHPVPNTTKIIEVDASANGYGGVLYQINNQQKELISLTSGTFNTVQATKDTYSYELEGAYQSVKKFSKMIEASPTVLFTDNKTLIGRFGSYNKDLTSYELRRLNYISQYIDEIKFIPGSKNGLADYLSRNQSNQSIIAQISNIYVGYQIDLFKLANEQIKDGKMKERLRNKEFKYKSFTINNKIIFLICTQDLICVPDSMIEQIINAYHCNSHQSARMIYKQLRTKFWFPKMRKLVFNVIKNCTHCQASKITRYNSTPLTRIQCLKKRFATIHIDIVGPLIITSRYNQYCLTLIDHYTKFLLIIPIKDQSSATVAQEFVQHYVKFFGIPSTLISDNGNSFTGKEFTDLLNKLQVKHVRTTPHHPQSNGLLERQHRKIKDSIRALNEIKLEWDILVPMIQLSWNNAAVHNATYSPAQIVFGQEMILPNELFNRNILPENQPDLSNQQIEEYLKFMSLISPFQDKHHSEKKLFRLNGMDTCKAVYAKNHSRLHKLLPTYKGPFKILKRFDNYMEIQINGKPTKISIEDLKPAFEANIQQATPVVIRDEEIKEQVNKMMQERKRGIAEWRSIQHVIDQRIQDRENKLKNSEEIDIKKIIKAIKENPDLIRKSNEDKSEIKKIDKVNEDKTKIEKLVESNGDESKSEIVQENKSSRRKQKIQLLST